MTSQLYFFLLLLLFGELAIALPSPARHSENIRRNWRLREEQQVGTSHNVNVVKGHGASTSTKEPKIPSSFPVRGDSKGKEKIKHQIKYRPVSSLDKDHSSSSTSLYRNENTFDSSDTPTLEKKARRKETSFDSKTAKSTTQKENLPHPIYEQPSTSAKQLASSSEPDAKKPRLAQSERDAKREEFMKAWDEEQLSTDLPADILAERVFYWNPTGFTRVSTGTFASVLVQKERDQVYYDAYIKRKRQLTNSNTPFKMSLSQSRMEVKKRPSSRFARPDRALKRAANMDQRMTEVIRLFRQKGVNFEGDLEDVENQTRGKSVGGFTKAICTRAISRYLTKQRDEQAALRFKRLRDQAWTDKGNMDKNIRKYWRVNSP